MVTWLYIHIYIYIYIYIYTYNCVCVSAVVLCLAICLRVYIFVCMYCVCTYVRMLLIYIYMLNCDNTNILAHKLFRIFLNILIIIWTMCACQFTHVSCSYVLVYVRPRACVNQFVFKHMFICV